MPPFSKPYTTNGHTLLTPDKLPPQNIDAEKSLLGALLIDRDAINRVADTLRVEDFYHRNHQLVYESMVSLFEKREPIDLMNLSNRLSEVGVLDEIGGVAYLTSLATSVPTSAHASSYAKIIQRKKMLRDLIDAANHIIGLGYREEDEIENLLDEAEQKLFSVSQRSLTKNFVPLSGTLNEAIERITMIGDGTLRGHRTQYRTLDDKLGGLQRSDLIVLAARPSIGKTAFAINLAYRVAKQGIPVGIFSLEMSIDQVVDRLIAVSAGVSLSKLRTGHLSHQEGSDDFLRITMACDELRTLPIFIDDAPSPNILQMRTMTRRLQAEQDGLGLLIVDYLQLMSSRKSYDSPVQQVTEISRGLKGLAKELNIPIIALSQLSRAVEQRDGHRPRLSDLRDSGCITGDSLIMRADTGELISIKELAERTIQAPIPVFSLDKNLKLTIQPLVKAFHSNRKEIFELKLRSGRVIKASANHPFYKLDGWQALENLKVGDRISTPRSLEPLQAKQTLKDEELILLAHLIGDGCILPKQPYHYTSADKENIKIVQICAKKLFNIESRVVKQENWWHVYLPTPYRLTHRIKHPITLWYEQLSLERVRSYHKRIPEKVFSQPNSKIAIFLKHLWATDGNISWKKLRGRLPSAAIYYCSTSKVLIHQLQHLLLRFGIQSSTRAVKKEGYRLNYQIHVQGSKNQLLFLKTISCYGSRGNIIPQLVTALNLISPNVNLDTIPREAWQTFIIDVKTVSNMGWREITAGIGRSYSGSAIFNNGLSRDRMFKIASFFKDPSLINLAQSHIYWDEIASISSLGVEDVYDATVLNTHNFIANDIILHNSIEQDADLVFFIHREDKINIEKARENNTENIAQLIIAKHRNGPTGEIEFRINPESLEFLELDKLHDGSLDISF